MKRIWICLLLLAGMLCGCHNSENTWPGYAGSLEGYEYCHAEGRDRAWEEDILYLAETCLSTHPYVMETDCWVYRYPEPFGDPKTAYSSEIYQEKIRNRFLDRVNRVIPRIPEYTDARLAYEAKGIVAALGDIHSNVTVTAGDERVFPVCFVPITDGTEIRLYAVRVPEEHENIYLGRLVAVNDVPVEKIIEDLTPYIPAENQYFPIYAIAGSYSPGMISLKNALVTIGVMEPDADSARFTFETKTGVVEQDIAAIKAEVYSQIDKIIHPMASVGEGLFRSGENYWYEWIEEDTLYIRIASLREDPDYSFLRYTSGLSEELRTAEAPVRIILDFRYNTGGPPYTSQWTKFVEAVNHCQTDGIYLLINGNCISSGVAAPYQLTQALEGAELVGTPTAQFPNSPAGQKVYTLPNSGLQFSISQTYSMFAQDETDTALWPDITIYQTWEDYQNCKDTVLEYVRSLP